MGGLTVAAIKPKARGDLTVVELDGEAVIYDDANSRIHYLNPTATLVFSIFDGTATVRDLAQDIAQVYQVPPDEVEKQVRALLRDFRKANLLEGGVPAKHG